MNMENAYQSNKVPGSRKTRTTLDEINEEQDIRGMRENCRRVKNITTGKLGEKNVKIRSDDA